MKTYEFYQVYANTPISERFKPLDFNAEGLATLADIYKEMQELDEKIRPAVIRINNLLRLAEKHYARKEK